MNKRNAYHLKDSEVVTEATGTETMQSSKPMGFSRKYATENKMECTGDGRVTRGAEGRKIGEV